MMSCVSFLTFALLCSTLRAQASSSAASTSCSSSSPCATGYYCAIEDGSCSPTSTDMLCRSIPEACNTTFESEVCGCDGQTYTNLCEADEASVSVRTTGACPTGSATNCTANSGCASGQFCVFDFGTCSGIGQCGTIPASSGCDSSVVATVCGCDGKSYSSECVAFQSSVSINASGTCGSSSSTATGQNCTKTSDCSTSGSYCKYPDNQCSGSGVCSVAPTSCAAAQAPICGCDGIAYQNLCSAQQNGISVGANTTCFIPTACNDTTPCTGQYFCQRTFGACKGNGFCIPQPTTSQCVSTQNPICGCDGTTYTNQCFIDVAGISTFSNGTCNASAVIPTSSQSTSTPTSVSSASDSFPISSVLLALFLIKALC